LVTVVAGWHAGGDVLTATSDDRRGPGLKDRSVQWPRAAPDRLQGLQLRDQRGDRAEIASVVGAEVEPRCTTHAGAKSLEEKPACRIGLVVALLGHGSGKSTQTPAGSRRPAGAKNSRASCSHESGSWAGSPGRVLAAAVQAVAMRHADAGFPGRRRIMHEEMAGTRADLPSDRRPPGSSRRQIRAQGGAAFGDAGENSGGRPRAPWREGRRAAQSRTSGFLHARAAR